MELAYCPSSLRRHLDQRVEMGQEIQRKKIPLPSIDLTRDFVSAIRGPRWLIPDPYCPPISTASRPFLKMQPVLRLREDQRLRAFHDLFADLHSRGTPAGSAARPRAWALRPCSFSSTMIAVEVLQRAVAFSASWPMLTQVSV